ncbi:type IV pilus modification protein PilV [Ectothiorhodospira marina]|uniref:Type IV pilus assembly protein PilV n=1 Tax=Ectothiorhodospira marina TaxID=1396821 RepID=A0A1H7R9X3_9GAMM|nr:type IV pilus modification protein PilV [Ectothiorhodospira marina]SEL56983.1 type IV pilus assembly protein PilV [Ectothiorhodospira marina]
MSTAYDFTFSCLSPAHKGAGTLQPSSAIRWQAGVGLIEVLVAVLILSLGLLGMAALQTRALQANQWSFQQGVAVMQAYDIADAIRADVPAMESGHFNVDMADAAPGGSSYAATAVAAWRANLTNLLGPEASGSITCDGQTCEIVTRWKDLRAEQGEEEDDMSMREMRIEFRP